MPTPNPTLRREYKGAAAATALANPMTNVDISFVLVAASNWPTGAVGKFIVTINRGLADEEKILCDSQTGRTVACLLANRGFDGTTAQAHGAGATVECTISAFDADEWNQHTNATTGVHGVVDSGGHLIGKGATPVIAAAANAGTTPPTPIIVATSTDQGGSFSFGTGTAPATGAICTVTFATPYATAPNVVITNNNNPANPKTTWVTTTTAGFTINQATPVQLQPNTSYGYDYVVVG